MSEHTCSGITDPMSPGTVAGSFRPNGGAQPRPSALRPGVPFLIALLVVAFWLRVIAALVLHQVIFAAGYNFFTRGDDQAYDSVAWQQAQAWRGVGPGVDLGHIYLLNAYTYTEAGLYLLVGHHPFAMILTNCAFGALTAGLVYLLALRLFDHFAARFSAMAAAFFPSLFFWSLLNLKDVMSTLFIALLLFSATCLLLTGKQWLILPTLVTLTVVGSVRVYIGLLLSVLIPVTIAFQRRGRFLHKWRTAAALAIGGAMIVWFSGSGAWLMSTVPLLPQLRYATAGNANSAYVPTAIPTHPAIAGEVPSVATPTVGAAVGSVATIPASAGTGGIDAASPPLPDSDAITRRGSLRDLFHWFPTGLAFALAAPFPWAARRPVELVTIPEMLLWYVAMVLAVIGVGVHWRQWRWHMPILGYLGVTILVMAMAEGTVGTLLRHRTMIIVPMLPFSGAGAGWLWHRRRSRRRTWGTQPQKIVTFPPTISD